MIIIYGTRFYGRVEECGPSFLGTQFVHIWYLPLIPIGSHLVLGTNPDGTFRGIATGMSGRSVFAGYARVWGPVALVAAILLLAMNLTEVNDISEALALVLGGGLAVGLALAACVLGWFFVGRLSADAKQQRAVYAQFSGAFVDPADMAQARYPLREGLMHEIATRVQGLAGMGYRVPADPVNQWAQIALDPSVADERVVSAAFTLARVDGSLSQGAYKDWMNQAHAQLWQKLRQMNPPYLRLPI